jgi:phage regulator Rha-like protein
LNQFKEEEIKRWNEMYKQLEQIKNQSSEQRNAVLHKLMEKSEENKNKLLLAIENFEKCNKSTEITDL